MAERTVSNARALPASARDVLAPKTGHLIAANLRRLIIRGELLEGDALPSENELMEQFQVSRPTLREALRVLESEGFVEVRRGARGGVRVRVPTEQAAARQIGFLLQHRDTTLRDLYEARVILEAPTAARAAKRRTRSDLQQLEALLERGEAAGDDLAEMLEVHHEFHALIVELGGSKTLEILSAMLASILHEAIPSFVRERVEDGERRRLMRRARKSHAELVELIAARDAAGAEELWRKHLDEGGEEMLRGVPETTVLELLA
jgi:DNA-binding FadR family transcriptional regulator